MVPKKIKCSLEHGLQKSQNHKEGRQKSARLQHKPEKIKTQKRGHQNIDQPSSH